ncbi:MAG: glycosyltransferase [Flavobacteriaceae bacterium]
MPLSIIIPCYNEANRFPTERYLQFLKQQPEVRLVFVDDGSSDTTEQVLSAIVAAFPKQTNLIVLEKNQGKAGAVQKGMLWAVTKTTSDRFAYLDADLSTSLEECLRLSEGINENCRFIFGSRILKTDNQIERKWYRFLIGRVVATAISTLLGISVYDTQCGCKILHRDLVELAFKDAFSSRWLFDVEIFFRLIRAFGKEEMVAFSKEVPLDQWIDTEDSRVKFSYMFRLWVDLATIYFRYRS